MVGDEFSHNLDFYSPNNEAPTNTMTSKSPKRENVDSTKINKFVLDKSRNAIATAENVHNSFSESANKSFGICQSIINKSKVMNGKNSVNNKKS